MVSKPLPVETGKQETGVSAGMGGWAQSGRKNAKTAFFSVLNTFWPVQPARLAPNFAPYKFQQLFFLIILL